MQEDMKDFVTSQPAARALFTTILGELCDFSVATFGKRLRGGRDGGLTRAATRAACGLPADIVSHGIAPRPGPRVVETVATRQVPGWLLGDERVACPVPCVSREALPRQGLLLGVVGGPCGN